MGSVASTPRGDAHPKEHGDYLLGVLVGKRAVDIHSQLWERLLNLPLDLHWPDTVINEACQNIAQNSTSTGHLAKLLFHLAWTLQEAVSGAPDSHLIFAKATNAVRFSSVFLKYSIEHLTSDGLTSCLSLCLNDKEADMTGLTRGNQTVASFVVLAMLSFIGNSDVNPSTYLLHLEVGNLLLVMMSTQLHSAVSPGPKNVHIFLDAALSQLMPLLEMLYDAPRKSSKQIYMLLIILLILSQDSSFNASIHKLVLPGVPWFKERLLTQTTLGSLMIVILIRTVKYNLATLRDVYLHTNCLATLSNMAPHVHKLNAYAAQRLVSLFDMLSRKYIKLADASAVDKSSNAKVSSVEKLETAESVSTELHIYTDFLRIVLEIINAILTYALPRNPEVVYALLHRQELFQPFRDHLRFNELIENIFTVLSFFNMRLDAQNDEGEWSVENVLQVIIANTRSWRGEGMKMFTQLQFTYEEELCPEEFFVPYVWQLVVSHSGIAWDSDTITLFPSKSSIELDRLEDTSDKGFEMPSTPRVEV